MSEDNNNTLNELKEKNVKTELENTEIILKLDKKLYDLREQNKNLTDRNNYLESNNLILNDKIKKLYDKIRNQENQYNQYNANILGDLHKKSENIKNEIEYNDSKLFMFVFTVLLCFVFFYHNSILTNKYLKTTDI